MDGSNFSKFELPFRHLPGKTKKDHILTINQTPSLNPRTSEYEGGVLPSRLRRLVTNLVLAYIVTVGQSGGNCPYRVDNVRTRYRAVMGFILKKKSLIM